MSITLETQVEDLVRAHPQAGGFLADRGVVCIRCGEPYWGTLGELMAAKGIAEPAALVAVLNAYLQTEAAPE